VLRHLFFFQISLFVIGAASPSFDRRSHAHSLSRPASAAPHSMASTLDPLTLSSLLPRNKSPFGFFSPDDDLTAGLLSDLF